MADHAHGNSKYIKIYFILLALLIVSIVGPFIGIWWVTLITAFGIAFVKAYLVCAKFMHLDIERPIIWYLLATSLVFMLLFFAAVAPDVQNHVGSGWTNDLSLSRDAAYKECVGEGSDEELKACWDKMHPGSHHGGGDHGEGGHHDDDAAGHGEEGGHDKDAAGHGDEGGHEKEAGH